MTSLASRRVGLLMGGPSNERAVSLETGHAVSAALTRLGHQVVEIDPTPLLGQQLADAAVDVVFNALHGTFGEDGRLQGLLDWLQIPYTGEGVRASVLAFDKVLAKEMYRRSGVPVAADQVIKRGEMTDLDNRLGSLQLPVVVKPVAEGSSVGVHIVESVDALKDILLAGEFEAYLIEDFVNGSEFSVVCVGDRCLGSVEIEPLRDFYDYSAKYEGTGTRYHIPPRVSDFNRNAIEAAGLAAHRALGCSAVTRSDVILGAQGPVVLETNTLPGMTDQSLVPKVAASVGLEFDALIALILDAACCRSMEVSHG